MANPVFSVSSNQISTNFINECLKEAIHATYAQYNRITNNTISSSSQDTVNTYANINLINSSSHNDISNNTIQAGILSSKPKYGILISTSDCSNNIINDNNIDASGWGSGVYSDSGTDTNFARNTGIITENSGNALLADGGIISHGLIAKPVFISIIGSTPGDIITVTSVDANNFMVAIKKSDGSVDKLNQKVFWRAATQAGN